MIKNDHRYASLVLITSRSFSHSWLITGLVSRLTRRVPLVKQEHSLFRSTPVFSVVRVTPSLVLCVMFVERCLSVCSFSFGHCVVCPSSICGFWLPFWYLQTPLNTLSVLVCLIFLRSFVLIMTELEYLTVLYALYSNYHKWPQICFTCPNHFPVLFSFMAYHRVCK